MSTINEQMLKAIKEEMDLVISSGQEKVIVDYDKAQRVAQMVANLSTEEQDAQNLTSQYIAGIKQICQWPGVIKNGL